MMNVHQPRPVFQLLDGSGNVIAETNNTRLYSWGWAACRLFSGDPDFKVAVLYMEYMNVADPDDTITDDRDYLRLYVRMPEVFVWPGYEPYFPVGQGNALLFRARSVNTTGVHGKPFSAAANSKVYGAAIAAAPSLDDRTQDVLIARGYYPQGQHQVKQATGQLEATYKLPFE
jgi:hypothetical protein